MYGLNYNYSSIRSFTMPRLPSRDARAVQGICVRVAAVIKQHDQKQLGEESVYFILQLKVYYSEKSEQNLMAGTWRQELMLRPWKSAIY